MKAMERGFYLLVGLVSAALGGIYLLRRVGDITQLTLFGATISLILAFFGAALLVSAFRKSSAARGIFASYVIVVLSFPVAEVGLRIADIPKTFSSSEEVAERLEAQIALRRDGIQAQPMVPFSLLLKEAQNRPVPLFLSGYPDATTVYCREDEDLTIYQADENGFRNPPGLYARSETFDTVLLGDSFTHGACVDEGFTIADHLRTLLDQNVYNLGYGGTGVAHNLGAFIEYAERKRPKNTVLLLLEGSSISRLLNDEMPSPHARAYVETQISQGLAAERTQKIGVIGDIIRRETLQLALSAIEGRPTRDGTLQPGKGTVLRSLVEPIYSSKLFTLFFSIERSLIRDAKPGGKIPDCRRLAEAKPLLEKTFRYLHARSREAGGSLYVGVIPSARYLVPNFPDCEYEMIRDLTAGMNVPFIDLVADISALEDPVSLYAQRTRFAANHFNRAGYRFAAERIAAALRGAP